MDNREVVVAANFANKNANFDVSGRPVRALITGDGVQYSTPVESVAANAYVTLLSYLTSDRYPRLRGTLAYVYVNISIELKAGTATADLKWKVQARNKDGTWVDMSAEQSLDNIGTSYVADRLEGFFSIQTNITQIPLEVKIVIKSNESKSTVNGTDIAFVDGGGGEDTITQVAAEFVTAGLVVGDIITVAGSTSNDGDYTLTGVAAGVLNVATASLTAEVAGDDVTITSTGQAYGKVKNTTVIQPVGSVGGIG